MRRGASQGIIVEHMRDRVPACPVNAQVVESVRSASGGPDAAPGHEPLQTSGFMTITPSSKEVFIMGLTSQGKKFRPSDWAERLAGVMSHFRPGGASHPGAHLSYSPWCTPNIVDGTKCVIVSRELEEYEPMAWSFVMNFARDNDLQVVEACLMPDARP